MNNIGLSHCNGDTRIPQNIQNIHLHKIVFPRYAPVKWKTKQMPSLYHWTGFLMSWTSAPFNKHVRKTCWGLSGCFKKCEAWMVVSKNCQPIMSTTPRNLSDSESGCNKTTCFMNIWGAGVWANQPQLFWLFLCKGTLAAADGQNLG